MDRRTT